MWILDMGLEREDHSAQASPQIPLPIVMGFFLRLTTMLSVC